MRHERLEKPPRDMQNVERVQDGTMHRERNTVITLRLKGEKQHMLTK